MSDITHLSRFIKFWFSHASLQAERDHSPHSIQISLLPSAYREKVLRVEGRAQEIAFPPEFFSANEAEIVDKLRVENSRGYDLFFFANAVRQGFTGEHATNADIERRLFFPIDFDYRIPFSLDELQDELGLRFAAVTISSEREFKHYQAFLGLDWCELPEHQKNNTTELARRICRMFGTDNMGDLKRIMRLPGLVNWKTAELEEKGEGKRSDTSLVFCEAGREYGWDEIVAAVEKFEESGISKQLRALRRSMLQAASGGKSSSAEKGEREDKGEFGRWDQVLELARQGTPSIVSGGRHNALASWGCQMCAARLPWPVIENNLDLLGQFGVSPNYKLDEPGDFERLHSDIKKKWGEIDAELDALEAERSNEIDSAMQQELPEAEWFDKDNPITKLATSKRTDEEARGCELVTDFSWTEFPPELDKVKSPHIEKVTFRGDEQRLDFGPPAQGPSSLLAFSAQLVRRCELEKEEHWVSWLGDVIIAANNFNAADSGSIAALCGACQERLAYVGALREGRIYGPVVSSDEKRAWSMSPLNEAEARVVVRNVFFKLSAVFLDGDLRNNKVGVLPKVQRALARKKKPKLVFAGKGEILAQFEREMMLRVAGRVQGGELRERGRVVAFQNGVIDLDRWQRILDEADPWGGVEAILGRVFDAWVPNLRGKVGVFNPELSWTCHPRCVSASFGVPRQLINGSFARFWRLPGSAAEDGGAQGGASAGEESGESASHGGTARNIVQCEELRTPMFDSFIEDCFPDDPEAWRGVLLLIAYCLLPDNPLQRYFFFEGVGGSGKGTLASLISLFVGARNTGLVDIERMKSDAWLGPLEGKNLAIIDEAEGLDPRTMRHVMHELARITGSERVSARVLRENATEIEGGWKFILIANEQPESADKSGQQSRRVVPVYFAQKKQGQIVPLLHRKIYRAEGDRIATKAILEYLALGMPLGEEIFNIDSPAFREGRRRFEESTGGIRKVLTLIRKGDKNMPKLFIESVVEIWIERKESRKYLHRALDKTVTTEMAVLGFREASKARMPWAGPDGKGDLLKGFLGCEIDTLGLLEELEMTPDELLSAIREKCVRRKKLWLAARHLLDLSDKDFAEAEGQAAGQQNFFD